MAVTDIIVPLIAIFMLAISGIIGLTLYNTMLDDPDFNASMGSEATTQMGRVRESIKSIDGVILIFYVLFIIATLILSYIVPTHPIFFALLWIVTILLLMITPYISNTYDTIALHPSLSQAANEFPTADTIFQNAPLLVLVHSALITIVMFIKSTRGGGEGL